MRAKPKDTRSHEDKRLAVAALLQDPSWRRQSDRAIAREAGLGSTIIPRRMRRQLYPGEEVLEREYVHKSGQRTRMAIDSFSRPAVAELPFGDRLKRLMVLRKVAVKELAAITALTQKRIRELLGGSEPTWPEAASLVAGMGARVRDLAGPEYHAAARRRVVLT